MEANLFYPIYQRIERDFIKSLNFVYLDDKNINVYSIYNADMIIRIAMEIESIAKEVYYKVGGSRIVYKKVKKGINKVERDLYFDLDCIKLLNQEFNVCNKKLKLISNNIYLNDLHMTALEYCDIKSPKPKDIDITSNKFSLWKYAYQNLKHDRINSMQLATYKNVLYALGSLYILNIYYHYLNWASRCNLCDDYIKSDIFSPLTVHLDRFSIDYSFSRLFLQPMNLTNFDEAIYISKYNTDDFYYAYRPLYLNKEKVKIIAKEYLSPKNYEIFSKNKNKWAPDMYKTSKNFEHQMQALYNSDINKINKKELILNKYPINLKSDLIKKTDNLLENVYGITEMEHKIEKSKPIDILQKESVSI